MRRRYLATAAAALIVVAHAAAPDRLTGPGSGALPGGMPARFATLQHDPQFILETVARRMGVNLHADVPLPAIRLESGTALERLQAAAEKQWGSRPQVFVTTYAPASNEIYLIDEAALYEKYSRTLDDSLAHELVHYIQAKYLGDRFDTEWSEVEAVAVQTWFREAFMAPGLAAARAQRERRRAEPYPPSTESRMPQR